jgi:hypothetical protein
MSIWTDIVTTAVVGTERQALPTSAADAALQALLAQLDSTDREGALLHAAALTALHERAGRLPAKHGEALPEAAPAETLPRCNVRVTARLKLLLQGQHAELLPECLTALANAGQRVPEELLIALLERGRSHAELAALLPPVLGERGRWLARQHPDGASILSQTDDETIWETGTLAQRKVWLRRLREREPARARELLQAVWEQEPAAARAVLLEQFEQGLSADDEPFLQTLAANKARQNWVAMALHLLGRLPESAHVQQAVAKAGSALELKPGGLLRKAALTTELHRDDLHTLLAAVPPSIWGRKWNKSATELVELAQSSKLPKTLLEAWRAAAARFKEADWAEALIPTAPQQAHELWQTLPPARQQAVLLRLLREHPSLAYDAPATPFLTACPGPWPRELGQAVLDVLRHHVQRDQLELAWSWRGLLSATACRLSPDRLAITIGELSALLKPTAVSFEAANEFLTLLQFRYDMLQELHQ